MKNAKKHLSYFMAIVITITTFVFVKPSPAYTNELQIQGDELTNDYEYRFNADFAEQKSNQIIVKYKENTNTNETLYKAQNIIERTYNRDSKTFDLSLEQNFSLERDIKVEHDSSLKHDFDVSLDVDLEFSRTHEDLRVDKSFDRYSVNVISASEGMDIMTIIDILNNDENVEYAQPNYELTSLAIPESELLPLQWGLKNEGQVINGFAGSIGIDINIAPFWDSDINTFGTLVAVLDTGIDIYNANLLNF